MVTQRLPSASSKWRVHALTTELGANHNTVEKALRLLEQEGVLVAQGPGRRRRIAVAEGKVARPLRLAILAFDPPAVTSTSACVIKCQLSCRVFALGWDTFSQLAPWHVTCRRNHRPTRNFYPAGC